MAKQKSYRASVAPVNYAEFAEDGTLQLKGPASARLRVLDEETQKTMSAFKDALAKAPADAAELNEGIKQAIAKLSTKNQEIADRVFVGLLHGHPIPKDLPEDVRGIAQNVETMFKRYIPKELEKIRASVGIATSEALELIKIELEVVERAQKNLKKLPGYRPEFEGVARQFLKERKSQLKEGISVFTPVVEATAAAKTAAAAAERTSAEVAQAANATRTAEATVEAAAAKVDIGTLEISQTLRFEGGSAGPEAKEALGRMFTKARELETAIKKSTGFNAAKNDIAQSFAKESPAIERVIEGVLQGKLDSLHDASLPVGAKEKIEALFTNHAKAEYEAFKTEFAKSDPIYKAGQKKLLEARLKYLGEIKPENVPGYNPNSPKATEDLVNGLKASVESEMKELETASAATTRSVTETAAAAKKAGKKARDSAEKEEGFWTKLVDRAKRNLGKEAWEERATETGFRTGGVVVGLGAVIDAIVRSNTKDDSGTEVSRSAAVRASEGIIGAVLAGGSAFIGGRK